MDFGGKLVRLRAYRREDVPNACSYINEPDVRRFLTPGIPFPILLEEEYKWFESQTAFGDTYNFAIETLRTAEYIGGCGVNSVDWKNSYAVVGIFLRKSHWSKGYGTDAMSILLRFIFEEMNLNKVALETYSFNERAVASYRKAGFKIEGVLREQIFREGRYYDKLLMGILRSEWENNNN